MIEVKRRSGIVISREYENEEFYRNIRKKLFRRYKNFNSEDYTTFTFYSESKGFMTIPRFFPIWEYVDCKINDYRHDGAPIEIEHNIVPRNETQQITIDHMLKNDNGIIQLNPGMGKTVISIAMIAERKRKTLILVHRSSLDTQWRDRFLQFTNLKEDDIALLRTAKFEEQLQKPIIIATVQTIISILKRRRMEFLVALNEANVGVFIGDEVHTTVGAPTFSQCSIQIPSRVCYGLSATPYRWDGNTDIIEFHLGNVFTLDDDSDTMKPEVIVTMFDYEVDQPKRYGYLHWGGAFQRSRYLNLIRKSKPVIGISDALLHKFSKGIDDRNVLFISERINFIEAMIKKWEKRNAYDSISKFIAGSVTEDLEAKLVFSTPGKIRDGIDAPWKDVLVMTSPIKNIAQIVGRITRTNPDKKSPIVIDMVDTGCEQIRGTLWSRLEYYAEKDWNVRFMTVNNITGEKIMIEESEAKRILQGGQ